MDISELVNITSKAWCMPILAALHDGTPGRQAPLLTVTGATRTAFSQSMAHLVALGLVSRNTGHGHPLRPEFHLAASGVVWARRASLAWALLVHDRERQLMRRAWILPILVTIADPRSFSEIRQELQQITDRSQSLALKELEAAGWLQRSVDTKSRPPRPQYCAKGKGAEISRALATI